MNFKSIVIGSLLTGLFIVALILFSVQFSIDNNTSTSLMNYEPINRSLVSINSTLSSSQSTAENASHSLQEESATPILTALGFFFRSILNAGNVFMNVVIGLFGSIFSLAGETLGIPGIVIGVLTAIVLVMLILSAWRVYRAGE